MFVDKRISINNYEVDLNKNINSIVEGRSTPSRFLCNIFWSLFPWGKASELLGNINMLDLGCGEGYLTKRLLSQYGKKNINKYIGIDVSSDYKMWSDISNSHKNAKFKSIKNVLDIDSYMEGDTNFLITQSVLEHIDTDIELFKFLKEYIYFNRKPFIQVHLFPSAACLWLYLYHGYRQYHPRSISRLTKIFDDDNTNVNLFRLGGSQSFQIQMDKFSSQIYQTDYMPKQYSENSISQLRFYSRYIFSHFLINSRKKEEYWRIRNQSLNAHKLNTDNNITRSYNNLLVPAIKNDMLSSDNCPLFYALIITSFLDEYIF
ncbi:MAG: hypothetical protein CMG71_01275 [Candidatus Marinimicrobia bacterium]|nr:hypothetical protein [Candidatus Neomarinimicrobiota bacterium]